MSTKQIDPLTLVVEGKRQTLQRQRMRLRVESGPDEGTVHDCSEPQVLVGTAEQNTLTLTDPAISRHHLRIITKPDGFHLADLDSTNGTFVGPARIHNCLLVGPAKIELGDSVLSFEPLDTCDEEPLLATDSFGEVIGQSTAMRSLFGMLHRVAEHNLTVLLEGETGVGKDLIAHELHRHSRRKDQPYVVVDCGAISGSLIASELFGHRRGSFSGAERDRIGAFEQAHGGTLFLDEIGELPLDLQPNLLRVLESGEIKRVGDTGHRKVDVRVIAATNRDLRAEINHGRFRSDLFYRLSVVALRVPSLDERREDIEPIARSFVAAIAERQGKPDLDLTDEQWQHLLNQPWPGNVRELKHTVERMVVLPTSTMLRAESPVAKTSMPSEDLLLRAFSDAKAEWVDRFERVYLERLLKRVDNNASEAARQAGIARSHLFRLFSKHDIRR